MNTNFPFLFLCFSFLLPRSEILSLDPRCSIYRLPTLFDPMYYQDGDLILGGIFSVTLEHATTYKFFNSSLRRAYNVCSWPLPDFYKHLLAFIYAIHEINGNPNILPNITLGYHLYDSCGNINIAIERVLQIVSGSYKAIPNFSCKDRCKLAGVVGDLYSETSLHIARILHLYGYSQISYGATNPVFTNKEVYPYFFQTLPNDQTQFLAIIKLLLHFGWTWIGVVVTDDDSGETQSRVFSKMARDHGICIEYTLKIPAEEKIDPSIGIPRNNFEFKTTSKILVMCSKVTAAILYFMNDHRGISQKTLITPASYMVAIHFTGELRASLHGSLMFKRPAKAIQNLKEFLYNVTVENRPKDRLLQYIFLSYSSCFTSDPNMNNFAKFHILRNKKPLHQCNPSVRLGSYKSTVYDINSLRTTYQVYKSVYAMAQSLHEMQSFFVTYFKDSRANGFKLKHYLQRIHFQDPTGEEIYFNEKGEMAMSYEIENNYLTPIHVNLRLKVGTFNISAPNGGELHMKKKAMWKDGEIPISKCSHDCPKGYKRVTKRGNHLCCFDCVECSEAEISTDTDKYSCMKCPEDTWPDETKNHCLPKPVEYLSYRNDLEAQIVSFFSVLFSLTASIILGIFLLYRDTPVVKANNQTLSFLLLVSITISFLCVLLFIGRPLQVTCMLRQVSFGILFSVAISCILAKTIMVYAAFKCTRPESPWRKLMGVKIPNGVVLVCSSIQVFISIIWLSTFPPFEESDTHTYADRIVIRCNEGSLLAFYMLLGYMGFLAFVSFIVAFLARNLPDRFNEAKNITFSMLVFCSVWIVFIPAYMNVMGKNTILVEIFAIMSSNTGILGCIFIPKCYILLMRPDLNSKTNMLRPVIGTH